MAKKLLLADDSITIQKVIGITFEKEDYELIVVDNGIDAIAKAREIKPDLILADAVMPGKDGYQVCKEIKADAELSSVPVILLAGAFEHFDEAKSKEVGADDHIVKPFESQTLIEKVEAQLLGKADTLAPAPTAAEKELPESRGPVPTEAVEEIAEDAAVDLGEEAIWDMPAEEGATPVAVEAPVAESVTEEEAAGISAEDDMWSMDELEEAAETTEPVVAAAEAVSEEAVASDEDIWGDMELEEEEAPVKAEEVAEAPEELGDEFGDFGFDDKKLDAGVESEAEEVIEEIEELEPLELEEEIEELEPLELEEKEASLEEVEELGEMMLDESAAEDALEAVDEFDDFGIEEEAVAEETSVSVEPEPQVVEEALEELEEEEGIEMEESFAEPAAIVEEEPVIEPIQAPLPEAAEVPAPEPSSAEAASVLSSIPVDKLEAIISKVAKEIIEKIAWEVVPELAETMIKEEIKKLKASDS
ncbi:MAG: response regulator [Proteobacteria bacterium]|nr:response regulator [Pseudomonadota bacterium]